MERCTSLMTRREKLKQSKLKTKRSPKRDMEELIKILAQNQRDER